MSIADQVDRTHTPPGGEGGGEGDDDRGGFVPPRGAFTPGGWGVLEAAARRASGSGDQVRAGHLLLGLLDDPGGPLASAIRAGGCPPVESIRSRIAESLAADAIDPGELGEGEARLSPEANAILLASALLARGSEAGEIAPAHIGRALFDALPDRLESTLRRPPLGLPVPELRASFALDVSALATRAVGPSSHAFPWFSPAIPSDDLTAAAEAGRIEPAVPPFPGRGAPDAYDRIARALYRRGGGHALITGWKGVGKTTAVRELARRASTSWIPFLKGKRFLWVDGRNVPPEESTACLTAIFGRVGADPNVILCLDGLGSLLRKPGGGGQAQALRSLIEGSRVRVVGVLDRLEYVDLASGEPEALGLFTRVDLEEPTEEVAEVIAGRAASSLAGEYGLEISKAASRKAVALTSTFLLGERLPAKAVRVLRRACDETDYERSQLGKVRREVTEADVVRVVGDLTGLPEETLSGGAGGEDFEAILSSAVVGQEDAVRIVADELALIRAGLSEPNKPASVLLFAGMTGVGKTELAKRLAELYSASKRLQTYSMGNYLEPHTVSGIIGVPPGYVGHEAGGRLVNELNADPHAVFLLDEAEKCHPNVWKPFLNLFDEGWIVDARGVKAHANRAIFILTTNAGDDAIAQMSSSGRPAAEIEAYVKSTLARVRQERSGQPVFPSQFLARIKRVVVFRPLDEGAMIGVARMVARRVASLWLRRREKVLDLPDPLVERIGRMAFRLNEAAGGKEGGRIVRKLVSDLVEGPVQREAARRLDDYRRSRTIAVREIEAKAEEGAGPPVDEGRPSLAIEFLAS